MPVPASTVRGKKIGIHLEDEAAIQRTVATGTKDKPSYLKINGWFVIRNQQNIGSHKGLADVTAIKDGLVLQIEFKSPRGKQRPDQVEFQREWEEHGGIYLLIDDIDEGIAEIERVVEEVRWDGARVVAARRRRAREEREK